MKYFIRFLLILLPLIPIKGHAQGVGQLQSGQIFGNSGSAQGIGFGALLGAYLDRSYCSTQGNILYRGSSLWQCITPAANSVLATNGSNVPSLVTTLPSGLTAPSLTVTTAFTATGLVTNADLANPATTVNGQSCVLGSSCTISTTLIVGTSTITGGPGILYNTVSGGTLTALTAVNSAVVSYTSGGSIQASTTLPSGLTAPSLTVTTAFTATGLVPYAALTTGAVATCSQYSASTASTLLAASAVFCPEIVATFGTTTTFNFASGYNQSVTLTGNITTMTLSNVTAGMGGQIRFIQDGTGSRTTVWNSIFKFAGGTAPTLSTTANNIDVLFYNCVSSSLCYASLTLNMK